MSTKVDILQFISSLMAIPTEPDVLLLTDHECTAAITHLWHKMSDRIQLRASVWCNEYSERSISISQRTCISGLHCVWQPRCGWCRWAAVSTSQHHWASTVRHLWNCPTLVSTSACPPQTFNIIQTVVDHQPNFFLQHHWNFAGSSWQLCRQLTLISNDGNFCYSIIHILAVISCWCML